jgi:hypothetical protein
MDAGPQDLVRRAMAGSFSCSGVNIVCMSALPDQRQIRRGRARRQREIDHGKDAPGTPDIIEAAEIEMIEHPRNAGGQISADAQCAPAKAGRVDSNVDPHRDDRQWSRLAKAIASPICRDQRARAV